MTCQSQRLLNKEYYDTFIDPDGITKEWVLTEYPYIVAAITALYLLVVLKVGPAYMKDREPYKLKTLMRIYNLVQVLGNSFILYKTIKGGHMPFVMNSFCDFEEEMKSVRSAEENQLEKSSIIFLYGCWYFLVLKGFDLLDTIFMILRKKSSHVTFLHVYHHSAVVVSVWLTFYYFKTPQAVMIALPNVFVHAIMYGYYFLATFSSMKRFLWWKRHLTKIQLIQFFFIMSRLTYLYYNNCDIPPGFTFLWMFNTGLVCALFINFYIKAYIYSENKTD